MTDTTSDASAIFGTGQFFERGNYAPVTDELTEFDLPVEGAIPAELNGWYLRNGPNPRQATAHWFTGDGMIHGIRLEGGRAAWYRNRWVRTDSFKKDFPLYNADGTRNLRASVANTHVVNHAGKTLALVESSLPYEITNDLETVGAYDFGGKLVDSMTAHPKICPTTGELHFFGYGNIFAAARHLSPGRRQRRADHQPAARRQGADDDARLRADRRARHLHGPADRVQPRRRAEGRWRHALPVGRQLRCPARRAASRRSVRRGALVRDRSVLRVPRRQCVRQMAIRLCCRRSGIPNCGATAADSTPTAVLWSWTIDLQTGKVTERQLDDRAVEFPRIDDRLAGLPARYAVSVGMNELVRYDLSTGSAVEHRFGTAESPGRPG